MAVLAVGVNNVSGIVDIALPEPPISGGSCRRSEQCFKDRGHRPGYPEAGVPGCCVSPVPIQFLFSSHSSSHSSSHTVFLSSYSVPCQKTYILFILFTKEKRIGTRKNCMGTGIGTGIGTEKELNRNW